MQKRAHSPRRPQRKHSLSATPLAAPAPDHGYGACGKNLVRHIRPGSGTPPTRELKSYSYFEIVESPKPVGECTPKGSLQVPVIQPRVGERKLMPVTTSEEEECGWVHSSATGS